MSDIVEWVLEMDVVAGQSEALKSIMVEMSEATEADEPGCLTYAWYVNDDMSKCTIIETYSDNAAVMVHLGNFGSKFAERFLKIVAPTRMVVFGPASPEVREALAGFGAVHMGVLGGFRR